MKRLRTDSDIQRGHEDDPLLAESKKLYLLPRQMKLTVCREVASLDENGGPGEPLFSLKFPWWLNANLMYVFELQQNAVGCCCLQARFDVEQMEGSLL